MLLKQRLIKLGIIPLMMFTLMGCNSGIAIPILGIRPVNQIRNLHKHGKNNHQVYVQGKVSQQAPFLGSGAYQLQDKTGTIWVVTERELPQIGEQVFLKGNLQYQSIPINGQELGEFYLLELEQLQSASETENIPVTTTSELPSQTDSKVPSTTVENVNQAKPQKPIDHLFFPHKNNE